jgi:outer membrane lipopolysaccharide assembly protein LptE/RlpB
VEDIRNVGQAWQKIKNKKHRKTEDVEYCCVYQTYVVEENMWIGWRAEQAVIKQDMHGELWMEDLMKTALRKAEGMEDSYKTD